MKFSFSEEQEAFREMLRRFLSAKSTAADVRKHMETEAGYDPAIWRQMAEELALTALHIPEEYGGAGFGVAELAIASEELGRALTCAPFFASAVMASTAILHGGSEAQKSEWLPKLANGETIGALAVVEAGGGWFADSIRMTADNSGEGPRLSGEKVVVLDGMSADVFVVAARGDGGALGFYLIPADGAGVTRSTQASMDPTRRLARVAFDGAAAELLEASQDGAYQRTLDASLACLAHEMAGGAERLREDALEYVSMRMQFGRSIASFQVTKHKAADMLLDVELAKSTAYYAAAAIDDGDADASAIVSMAKAQASDVYMQTAIHAVQMHGGIGFTADNDTQLWFKRAKASEAFLGSAGDHRERMLANWSA